MCPWANKVKRHITPNPALPKSPQVRLSFLHVRVDINLRNSHWLFLILDLERPWFYQQCNAREVDKLSTDRTPRDNSRVGFRFRVRCDSGRCREPNDLFSFEIFLSPLGSLCWLWCVLMHESKFSCIFCGLQWYLGRRRSIQAFVFSSLGTGSIKAAIFIPCLVCLKVEKSVYNLKCV